MFEIKCDYCGIVFYREYKRINESIKKGWKQYCSLDCQYKTKTKRKEFKCGNSQCDRSFLRAPNEIPISDIYFLFNIMCSKSK